MPFGADTTFFGLLDRPIHLAAADVNVGLLVIFAITSMGVYGIVLAGWSSNSKYSLLGGLRSSAQMISYELSYGLSFAAVIMLAGSLSLGSIVDQQAGYWFGFIPKWYMFIQPIGFFIFLTAGVAETNRAPFDFPEAEQELVAGYHTEYSSMSFALFFLAEYVNMVTVSAVATDLFLGGWHGPFLPEWLGLDLVPHQGLRAALLLYLDALDAAALSLRPAHGVRLEVAAAGGGHQPARDGAASSSTSASRADHGRNPLLGSCGGRGRGVAARHGAAQPDVQRAAADRLVRARCRGCTCSSARRSSRRFRSSSTRAPSWCSSCSSSCSSTCRPRSRRGRPAAPARRRRSAAIRRRAVAGAHRRAGLGAAPAARRGDSDGDAQAPTTVYEIGLRLFREYAFAFEATSVLILVAMVGAIVLARKDGDRASHSTSADDYA